MKKLISKEAAISAQVYSRDLREYVVPVREIKNLREYDEPQEQMENTNEMLRVLFNRCMTLTHGSICLFCGIRDACDMRRNVWNKDGDRDVRGTDKSAQ